MVPKFIVALGVVVVMAEGSGGDGTIYIIRHGEKKSVHGDLSPTGEARAQYISTIFSGSEYKKPQALFAGYYSGEPERTLHTVQPTADLLHLSVDNSIHNGDHEGAAQAFLSKIQDGNSVVLVAWEHCNIEKTCQALAPKTMCDAFHHSSLRSELSSGCSWWGNDYDSIATFTVINGNISSITHDHQNFKPEANTSWVV